MRIVQLIPTLAVGGLERVATTLTLELHRRGEDVAVCTRGPTTVLTLAEQLAELGVPVVPVPRPRPLPRDLLASARAVAAVVRERRPDVVHAHNPAASIVARLACLLAGSPRTAVVSTYHGLAASQLRRAARTFAWTADIVVGIGPTASAELVAGGFPRERLRTVPNAVGDHEPRPADEVRNELGLVGAEIAITVGRYAPEKNQALLLDALAELAPRRPGLRGVLVGTGPLEDELRRRADELGIADRVLLTGPRGDAVDLVAASDVLASTSDREGLGLALVEAMTVGTPVVATAVGGVFDVVADGAGVLVRPGDAPELAAALERVLDDPDLRGQLVERGRRRVAERFTVEAMVDGYLSAYSAAAERRRARAARRRAGASPST